MLIIITIIIIIIIIINNSFYGANLTKFSNEPNNKIPKFLKTLKYH